MFAVIVVQVQEVLIFGSDGSKTEIFAKYPPLGGIDLSWRLSWAKGGILPTR